MLSLSKYASRRGEWLKGSGPEADVVLSTRVRLARNLADFPFLTKISPEQQEELVELLSYTVLKAAGEGNLTTLRLNKIGEIDKQFLMERHIISHELSEASGTCAVVFNKDESLGVMIAEEDHLRMQVIVSGLDVSRAWSTVDGLDDNIETQIDYAFSHKYGFLTACPTNVGTGMRASVMMHLPGLVETKHIDKVHHTVAQMNLAVRGLYGEGTQAFGDVYQVSNQVTLGKDEKTIVEEVDSVTRIIVEYERRARKHLIQEDLTEIRDKLSRHLSVLKSSYLMDSREALSLLSSARLGLCLGLIKGVKMDTVSELFLASQPAHIQALSGKKLTTDERKEFRAQLMRERFQEATLR